MQHIKEITPQALGQLNDIKAIRDKIDALLESMSIDELRELYKLDKAGTVLEIIMWHGEKKKGG